MIEKDRSSKQFYEKSRNECLMKESIAVKREKEARYIIDNQNKVLNEKAKQMTFSVRTSIEQQYQKREKELRKSYELKELQLHTATVGGLLYSFYVTLLALITTVRFKSDLKAFIKGICSICMMIWESLLIGANTALNICYMIPNEIVAMLLSWVVRVLIILLVLVVLVIGVCLGGYIIFRLYRENYADWLGIIVFLLSFSLLVWFGDSIGEVIKWNLVGIFLIIQVAYVSLRMYVKSRKM